MTVNKESPELCGSAEVAGRVGGAEVAASVASVVEMPGLARLDELAAAAACDLATGDSGSSCLRRATWALV
jgi:hypothetical protein